MTCQDQASPRQGLATEPHRPMSSNDTVSQREAETWLDRYARHIVAQGVGLQRGQALFVRGQRRFHDFALRLGELGLLRSPFITRQGDWSLGRTTGN